MQEDLRKELITQLKNSFEEDMPAIDLDSSYSDTTFVSLGDMTVPRKDIYEAIDYFTKASEKLSIGADPDKLKRAGYCDLAGAALTNLIVGK